METSLELPQKSSDNFSNLGITLVKTLVQPLDSIQY